jgi:hypothetical protein
MRDSGNPRAFPSAAIDPEFGGMTLRDWFAGQALIALADLISRDARNPNVRRERRTLSDSAEAAYELADAMLAERDRGAAA